jgi:copper chaperone CopZ
MRVKKALESVTGVQSTKADHKKGNVVIDANDDISIDALVKAVNDTGLYEAHV